MVMKKSSNLGIVLGLINKLLSDQERDLLHQRVLSQGAGLLIELNDSTVK
jgi:hypothetical protein